VPGGEASAESSETDDAASEEPVDEESTDGSADSGVLQADLAEVDGSGASGGAVLSDELDGLAVTIQMDDGAFAAGQKPYVHIGTCDNYNPEPSFSLRPIDEEGLSESRQIAVAFADLTSAPHAIVLYRSRTDRTVVACGELAA
jgi:hypothetical protein